MAEEANQIVQAFRQDQIERQKAVETSNTMLASRQAAEVQAAMTVAQRFPRDQNQSAIRMIEAFKRQKLAEVALYTYPRGATLVQGLSIRSAECMAQNWGNLEFGIVELEQVEGESRVMAYCHDLETNVRQQKTFTVKHERHLKGGKVVKLTDPRDIYEKVSNDGARRLRACILGVIPKDIQDACEEQVSKTLKGNSTEPIQDRVRKMLAAFIENFGVTQEMIEGRLGHNLKSITEPELVTLRGIYQSLNDGMSSREQFFDVTPEQAESVDDLKPGVNETKKKSSSQKSAQQKQTNEQKQESLLDPEE